MTGEEKILDILALVQTNVLGVREDVRSLESRLSKLEFKIETDVETKLDALGDGHAAILEQMTPRTRIDDMESEIRFLKTPCPG